jgi:molybdopterin-containing oxidoreductase family iron-sulfur binding subunit
VHAAAHAINAALGNLGKTIKLHQPSLSDATVAPDNGFGALRELVREIDAGHVDTLVITAWNPVYAAPADADVEAALRKVNVIYRAEREDETSALAGWFVPAAHPLESWGDGRAHDGTITFRQPLVSPLLSGVGEAEVLTSLLGEADRSSYERLRTLHTAQAKGDLDTIWTDWIAAGLISHTARPHQDRAVRHGSIRTALEAARHDSAPAGELECVFAVDYKAYDGRYANNAWLQELPDPVSKLTWDNAALISPAIA